MVEQLNLDISRRRFLETAVGGLACLLVPACVSVNTERIASSKREFSKPEYQIDRIKIGNVEYAVLPFQKLQEDLRTAVNINLPDKSLLLPHYLFPTTDMKEQYPLGRLITKVEATPAEKIFLLHNVEIVEKGRVKLAEKLTKTGLIIVPQGKKVVLLESEFNEDKYLFSITADTLEESAENQIKERLPAAFLAGYSEPRIEAVTKEGNRTETAKISGYQYVPVEFTALLKILEARNKPRREKLEKQSKQMQEDYNKGVEKIEEAKRKEHEEKSRELREEHDKRNTTAPAMTTTTQ